MRATSAKDMLDTAILAAARHDCPRLIDLEGRIGDISGGWLVPCSDLVRERVDILEANGWLTVAEDGVIRMCRQAVTTVEGLDHARNLASRAAWEPYPMQAVWATLRNALDKPDEQPYALAASLRREPVFKTAAG